MVRQIIMAVLGIAIIAGGLYVARQTIANKQQYQPQVRERVTSVFTETVENTTATISIVTSGQLMAKNRLELFSEVQGVFEPGRKEFKPGVVYRKGELMIKINSDEYYATLQAQKSALYNQIITLLPDLRLDFPESFGQWDAYVKAFDLSQPVQPLPEPVNEREKLFVSGRNIYSTYYTVENLQIRLGKYNIYAPFTGVLTEALVQPGTLIRQGQRLGEFLDQGVFELQAAVNVQYLDLLRTGKPVLLRNIEHTKEYSGRVVRVDGKVDQSTQTITVFIDVRGNDLKEGMYLEAELEAKEEPETFEVSRKLLINDSQLFAVADTLLRLVDVEPIYYKDKTVIVRGLEDGVRLVSQSIPGAYPGMKVKVVGEMTHDEQVSL